MAHRPRYRPWPRTARWSGSPMPWLLPILLGVGLGLLCIHGLDSTIRPIAADLAQAKIRNQVSVIVSCAVEHTLDTESLSYSDMVTLQRDAQGRVTALTTSPVQLNTLRVQILQETMEQVKTLDSAELGIPLGSLTGLVYAADWGPVLPVRILSTAAADGDFRNEFTSTGINQTLHRIMLDVDVQVKLLIPGGTVDTTVCTSVCLAETVIVGEVPQAYLHANRKVDDLSANPTASRSSGN